MMNRHTIIRGVVAILGCAALAGCVTPTDAIRVGSYNIRLSPGDRGTPNGWENRKADLVALIRKMDLDAFGLQEVCPDQMAYLREQLPEFVFVGEHREANRKSGEASPVAYRKSRFEAEKSGTFWLSETPDTPGRKGWGAACPRVCSYLVLREKLGGRRFCFANTHTDHVSAEAREKGMLLIVERMKAFGSGAPIVFTGDHNCCYDEPPAKAARAVLKDARDITETPCRGPHNTYQGFGRIKDVSGDPNDKTKDYCIDYIYVTEGTRVWDFVTHDDKRPGTDLYPSDHFPVTATIELPEEEGASAISPAKAPAETGRKLYVSEYRDRMAGAWMGQSVGVAYGCPTEFKKSGQILTDDLVPAWKSERVNNTFVQDDLYVEMTFLETLEKRGVDVGPREAGIDFANSRYKLWCANANARDIIRKGIAAPDSSHPKNHPTPDDIDYQIESDYSGILSPGMPARVLKFGQTFGRIMNYGDGAYAGDFMGGMYAAAYFEADRVKVVEAGLKCIPAESWYAEMVRDMLAWYRENPKDWKAAWKKAVAKYGVQKGPRLGKVSWYGIDVKINGAMVILGYLWGEGDVFKTMDISTRGGYDSDCNPSSALGVLGVQIGLKGFGPEYTSKLDKTAKWNYTAYTWDGLLAVCEKLTREIVVREGGKIGKDEKGEYFLIPEKAAVPGSAVSSLKPGPGGDARLTAEENKAILYAPCNGHGKPSVPKVGASGAETKATPVVAPDVKSWHGANLLGLFNAAPQKPDKRVRGHFEECYFRWMKGWGFNFARLPMDYRYFLATNDWTQLKPEGFAKVDEAVAWGRKYGVHVQLCLHRAPGFTIASWVPEATHLQTERKPQEAFMRIWREFARRYRGIPNSELSFNLINEPSGFSEAQFIDVFGRTIDAIRAVDPGRFVMLDGNNVASTPVPHFYKVPLTGQAFRGYTPHAISHYKAWYIKQQPEVEPTWPLSPEMAARKQGIYELPEKTFGKYGQPRKIGYPVMVGEFGCYNKLRHETCLAWMEHCLKIWQKEGLGWAIWNVDGPFGFMDSGRTDIEYEDFEGHKLDRRMLDLLRRYAAPVKKADVHKHENGKGK